MNVTKKDITTALEKVMDPELNISIVDLGLVYETDIQGERVKITMTLTTMGCPLFGVIESEIKNRLQELGFKEDNIEIELVFDPPWSMEMMSESARAMIGI